MGQISVADDQAELVVNELDTSLTEGVLWEQADASRGAAEAYFSRPEVKSHALHLSEEAAEKELEVLAGRGVTSPYIPNREVWSDPESVDSVWDRFIRMYKVFRPFDRLDDDLKIVQQFCIILIYGDLCQVVLDHSALLQYLIASFDLCYEQKKKIAARLLYKIDAPLSDAAVTLFDKVLS